MFDWKQRFDFRSNIAAHTLYLFVLLILLFNSNVHAEITNSLSTYSRGAAPSGNAIVIDTYTTWPDDIQPTIGPKDSLIVNDTLIINGDFSFSGSVFMLNEGGVCIIYGNLIIKNKIDLEIGAHLIVGGNIETTGSKFNADVNQSAAIYVLGTVSSDIVGLNCDDPSSYEPHLNDPCTYGDIISLEDNENDSTGIYDLFVSGDAEKGVTPVYSELCGGDSVTISALFETAAAYQWCDSLGNELANGNEFQYKTSEPGEYFVKIYVDDAAGIPDTSHRAKIIESNLSGEFSSVDDTCSLGLGEILFYNSIGGSGIYEYSIDGGMNWQTSQSFSHLNAGTYDVRIKDAAVNGCELVLDAAYVISLQAEVVSVLPFTEDFSEGVLPPCWQNVDNVGNGQVWEFNNPGNRIIPTSTAANGFAILDSDNYGSGNSQDADLISPVFDFTNYTDVTLNFEHYFVPWESSVGTLEYSIDGGSSWIILDSFSSQTSSPGYYSNIITDVAGESNVQFKWNYVGNEDFYWAIDDIQIIETVPCPNPPTASCRNITIYLDDSGNATITGDQIDDGSAAGCGKPLSLTPAQNSFTCADIGDNTVELYVLEDGNPSTGICTAIVTVQDTIDPTITCPADILVDNDLDECGAVVNYTLPVGSDNCSGATTALSSGLGSGALFPIGITTETYTVTDGAGNTASCSFHVTVVDGQSPVLTRTVSDTITVSNTIGLCGKVVNFASPTASDNCPGTVVTRTSIEDSGGTFPIGITPVTYEATDSRGNISFDTIFVKVVDAEAPTIVTCPLQVFSTIFDTTVSINSLIEPLLANDNCMGATLTINPDTVSLSSIGSSRIEVVATDAYSNTDTCSFDVFVLDTSPIIKKPAQDIVCAGTTIEYSFVGAWPGNSKWSVQGPDATIDDKDAQTTDITFNAPGVYLIRAKIQDTGKPTFYNDFMVVVSGDPNSNPVSVSINANPSNSVCTGTEVTFTATPTNGGISPSYQWQLNGADVGSDQNSYINSGLIDGDKITCILTSSEVCSSNNPDTSAVITMDVNDIPSATLSGDATICSGQSTNLTVTLTGSGPWNLSYSDGSNSYNEDGITSSPHSIEVSPIINTSYSLISVSNVACAGTTSGSATITVESTPVAGTLTKTPDVNAVCDGDNVSAILTAGSGGNGTDELDYSIDGGSNWLVYTSGTNISTTGLNEVQIRTRRMANHCTPTAYETVNWIINSNSEITLDQSSTKICFGDNEAVFGYTSVAGSPDKYNIDFDTDAETAGFVDVVDANLTGGSITVTVPESATPATYNAVLSVNNSATGCTSVNYSISIVINPLPATGEIIPD